MRIPLPFCCSGVWPLVAAALLFTCSPVSLQSLRLMELTFTFSSCPASPFSALAAQSLLSLFWGCEGTNLPSLQRSFIYRFCFSSFPLCSSLSRVRLSQGAQAGVLCCGVQGSPEGPRWLQQSSVMTQRDTDCPWKQQCGVTYRNDSGCLQRLPLGVCLAWYLTSKRSWSPQQLEQSPQQPGLQTFLCYC